MECSARRDGTQLILENSRIRRVYDFNAGNLISRELTDKLASKTWALTNSSPDFEFYGVSGPAAGGKLEVTEVPKSSARHEHLRTEVTFSISGIEIRRSFRIYPDCPAIACDFYLRKAGDASQFMSLSSEGAGKHPYMSLLERLEIAEPHLQISVSEFFDVTDNTNNPVRERNVLPYRGGDIRMPGNVLLAKETFSDCGIFILKESPAAAAQLHYAGYDFIVRTGSILNVGIGLILEDLEDGEWVRGYGSVAGVGAGDYGLLCALREYQNKLRVKKLGRDHSVMLNTWGDRSQEKKMSEAFALKEIKFGSHLGVSHFQLDAGWQKGHSIHSSIPGGSLDNIWSRPDYWTPHPERFPKGLKPVADAAKAAGIELCLWYNPSKDDGYANWEKDAETLIGLNKQYGIRTFKIDGVELPTKKADVRFRKFLERVREATNDEATFNLDVTAGKRWGFHLGTEYGNLFLENRYTDWGNYYPHYTLRNLWLLSKYMPPQSLQIEFLNIWRNADKYPGGDLLAPRQVPFEYCFAETMAAQPLAWFEASELPPEAFNAAPAIKKYRELQENIHDGIILPIGEEPLGMAVTGFQSIKGNTGFFLVYRQLTDRLFVKINSWGLSGKAIKCHLLMGLGADFSARVPKDGAIEFDLPEPFTYAVYEYKIR